MTDPLTVMSLEDLRAMMVEVLRSNPPARDREFIHRLANEIAAREKALRAALGA